MLRHTLTCILFASMCFNMFLAKFNPWVFFPTLRFHRKAWEGRHVRIHTLRSWQISNSTFIGFIPFIVYISFGCILWVCYSFPILSMCLNITCIFFSYTYCFSLLVLYRNSPEQHTLPSNVLLYIHRFVRSYISFELCSGYCYISLLEVL